MNTDMFQDLATQAAMQILLGSSIRAPGAGIDP